MASSKREKTPGEILVAWQKYKAESSDELTLRAGDVVELLNTNDTASKRIKLDPELDTPSSELLDSSAAKHKLSVKPKRTYASSRHSPTRLNLNARWLVREVSGSRKQGWVPCKILQTIDDPTPGAPGLPGDAVFRRQAVVKELVETEQEFVRDLDNVVQNYLICAETTKVPNVVKDNLDVIFGNLKEIAEFHRTVLMEGVKYYANEPHLLGKAFLRLERDFDKHVNYCRDESQSQVFLESSSTARDYFDELSQRLGDDKNISEHLKLPIQRINDYQLLLKELVRYSACLGEDHADLQKALELMLSVPHRARDDKFTSSIEGYRGSIHKLGRLLAHDWFSVQFGEATKERYLFLFRARILICKVRRISEDRSVFQLKDIIRLPLVEVKDHPEKGNVFELLDKAGGQSLVLTAHREHIKEYWLQEIREFAKEHGESEESEEFQLASPPSEQQSKAEQSIETLEVKPDKKEQEQIQEKRPPESKTKEPKTSNKVEEKRPDPKPVSDKLLEASKSETPPTKPQPEKKVDFKLEKSELEQQRGLKPGKPDPEKRDESQSVEPTPSKLEISKPVAQNPTEKRKLPETQEKSSENKRRSVLKVEKPQQSNTEDNPRSQQENPDPKSIAKENQPVEKSKPNPSKLKETPELKPTDKNKPQEQLRVIFTNPLEEDKPRVEVAELITKGQTSQEEEHHLDRLKAVEPLVHFNDPRIPETPVPYTPKLPPELTPGSAVNKLQSVEKVSASDKIVDGEYRVGIEINVEVDDSMSRKYTSSSAVSGGYESAYNRRSASSYSSEGGLSSRYGTESSLTGKYSSDIGGSKYGDLTSKYGKYSSEGDSALTSSYTRRSVTGGGDNDGEYTSSYTRRSLRSSNIGGDEGDSYSYSKKIRSRANDDDDDSYTFSRRSIKGRRAGDDDADSHSYSRRAVKTVAESSLESKDGDAYSYSKRTVRAAADMVGDGDSYSIRKSVRKTVEGSGEPMEVDSYSYSTRKALTADDSKTYGKRSVSVASEDGDYSSKYSIRSTSASVRGDDEEDYISKYSRKYSRNESVDRKPPVGDEEDVYAKYSRKYSRTDEKKAAGDEEEDAYTRYKKKYLRTDSTDRKSDKEEDVYAKYTRKYSRGESAENKTRDEEDSKYSRSYSRTESSERKGREEDSKYSRAYSRTESVENKAKDEDESKYSKSYSRSDSAEKKSYKSQKSRTDSEKGDKVSESKTVVSEITAVNGKESVHSESHAESVKKTSAVHEESLGSISTTMKTVRESELHQKTAEEKLADLDEGDDKPRFIKAIRGTNLEPGETAHFEVVLNRSPEMFAWLKDNKQINGDSVMSGRIQMHYCEKDNEFRLIIKQVKLEDAGLYSAIASNQKGKASCSAQLIVHELTSAERAERAATDKPEFLISLKDTELLEDTYLRFMVKVAGEPNPNVQFFHEGVLIQENVAPYQIIKEHSDKGFYELVIPDVKPDNAGLYKCVASNKFGETSCEATVTVTNNKEVFESMPEGEILEAGKKPVFQWKKDGRPFEPEERFKVLMGDDEDSLALVFQHVRPDDVGLYTCVAQTSRGHISCSAELTVHGTINQLFREPEKPRLVVEKKEPIVVNQGASAMLELQVKGYPKPNVKWMHKGKSIEASDKYKFLYEDEECMSLVIKNVQAEDAGTYTITAENELGTDTAEMSLTVKAPPKIKAKVPDLDVHADLLIQVPVEIEGIPKPTVHFYKDGKEIKKSEHIKIIEEAEKHILVIEKSTLKDAGSYSVVAKNEVAQVSEFWTIDVHSKPKVLQKLGEDKKVSQGENVELKVKIEAEPKAEVKWFKDDQEIKSTDHYVIKEDGDSYILRITGAVTTDAARYKCKAVNIHGTVDDECTVYVKKPPKITKSPQDMTVTEHDKNVTLDVSYEAYPKPTIKWYLDEMEITETKKEFTRVESDNGAKLVIKEVSSELSGKYTCKLSNECGGVETSAKLTVNCAPRIIKQLKDTTVEEGSTLHLEVEVEGCPTPTVKWLRNGREVNADARIKISRDTQRNETYNLAVNLIKYEEQGEYEVFVTNALGTVSSKSYVTVHKVTHTDAVEETEEPPKKLKIEVVEDEEEPQAAEIAEKEHIEEVAAEEPTKPIVEEVEEPKKSKGKQYEKQTIEERSLKSPEPIVEEPESPSIQRGVSMIEEDIEKVEFDVGKRKASVEDILKRRPSRAKSVQIEEIEEVEPTPPQTPVETDVETNKKLKRGVSARKESIEVIEEISPEIRQADEKEVEKRTLKRGISARKESLEIVEEKTPPPKTSEEIDVDTNRKLKRGISARKESLEFVEEKTSKPKTPEESDVDINRKLKRGISARKESIEIVEEDQELGKPKKVEGKTVDRQKSQKGIKEYPEEEDVEIEALLNRAKKQRSLIEDVSVEKSKAEEAAPTLLDSNMKDGSRPESLEITYIVRGTANPPPVATWTLNDKEIKPDGHLRMTTSQDGEEFRLEIKKLEMKDAGVYKCVLSNPLGQVAQQAVLEVTPERELRRPKLKKALEDQTIVKKNTVTFKAIVIGDPIPDVVWCKDGKEITNDEFEKHKILLEAEDHEIEDGLKECSYSLTIPRCERCNAGKYSMKAKNKWGECDSSAELTIILRPEIEGPEDVRVVPGEEALFVCTIQSNPAPVVTWSKDGKGVEKGDGIEIVQEVENETYKLIFRKVKLADEGYYRVTAKNHLGETYSEARLKAIKDTEPSTEKPKFITGLSDETVEDRGEITVKVRADGLPKPEIRWFCNGKPIENDEKHKIETHTETQVTSTLTISNYTEAEVGLYKAIAVNVVGEAETTARISMLQTPPSFGRKLERSADANEGEPLELKAKINGSPKPTVAWYKDGELIPADDDRIKTTLLPDGTVKLEIDKVRPEDSGAYKLVVKNPNGENACLCAVAVNEKPKRPKFLKVFKDAKVPLAETMRLEAKVEAYPPPEIKWLKDGVPIRPSSNINIEKHPDGTVALVVDCMRPENAGKYEMIVSNKHGEASSQAKIEVEKKPTKPEFTTRLFPQTVVEGFPVRFEVKAQGFPAPSIKWTRSGAEIISDAKHVKISELPDGTSVLLIDSADLARDAMAYRAVAINEAGEAETSAPLTVTPATNQDAPEERPMFLHGLKDTITDEGQPLILTAPFTANPIPSVEWTKDGQPIEPSDRVLMTCDGRKVGLQIDNAQPSDAGQYGVTIVNPLGNDSSEAKATVHKVFMPPSFTQRFTDLQQLPKRDAKFPCRVSGVPQPDVTWSKDGVPLGESDKYHIKRDGDLCCLYVNNCEPSDAGVYRATATNKEGQDNCTATLEVVEEIKAAKKAEPPVFLKRIGDTDLFKGMTAKFTACASGIPDPEVEWFHNDQKLFPSSRIRMETDLAGLLRLTIAGVDQDDLGKYSCKISNEHGSDVCHANLSLDDSEAKTKRPIVDQYTDYDKYKRSGAAMPLSDPPIISQMTDRHCTLSWRPSIPSAPRAPVTYQLEMCELPSGDWFTVRSGIRSCTCSVRNLEPFKDYKFRVRVENKYGISDPSPYAITHRQKLEPDLPKFRPYLPPEIDFRPETSPYFPRDFDIERPPHDNMAQAPRFLRQEHDTQYGVKDQNTNLFWFVYGYPKPKMTYYFNDELIEPGGRFDMSYTRNGQATLFINKMLDRDVGWYEAVARNEHGEARQRVRLDIAEFPTFITRPDMEWVQLRGRVKFEARIAGVPYPEIKWYKDWKPLAPSSRIKIQFYEPDTTVLIINDIIMKDEGLYSVSARNVAGSTSSSAMLRVEENDLEYNLRTYNNLAPIIPRRRLYTDLYDLGDELGRGTQGITYHAVERANGRNWAAKIMHGRDELRQYMYNELDMLNQLHHRRLISLYDAYETDDSMAFILELGAGGELVRDHLLRMEYYTESDIAGFMRQLLQGLEYMHGKGYGHMGLTLGDLLISHAGGDELKITDFGLTRRINMGHLYPLNYGMPEYVSPEAAGGSGVGLQHDMWGVGIITFILLSGRSPFRGLDDMETLTRIREGKWWFEEEWWSRISVEARDFISRLLVYEADGRMDVHAALRHPWLERADKRYQDEFRIRTSYLSEYWKLYREWYDNASCRKWYRRRPLEGAFTHPSRMVYPPNERYTPPPPVPKIDRTPRAPTTWEDQLPSRSPLNYEIGAFKSESHYQNGPDTYLLQLRDVDFPVRLREYMKVATNRGPGGGYIVSDENGYDWSTPIIRERRRFTDIMDEEIDDERRTRINKYGTADTGTTRRLRHEIGQRLDTYVEAEAFLESKQDGRLPFFREKPKFTAMVEGRDLELTCLAVGEPDPTVQWFKNDAIVAESHRIKIYTDGNGRSHFKLSPALSFDQGMYKVVARNKIGQTVARTRIVLGMVPDEPDSPDASEISDTQILLTWKQPKFDGNAAVLCYSLEYKLADDMDWTKRADNIDHEFYLMADLEPDKSYIFRLAAKNSIGWSEKSVPTAPIKTQSVGATKIQLNKAMLHLQQITDSGEEIEFERTIYPNYAEESNPVEWADGNAQENYNFISEISSGRFSSVLKAVDKRSDKVVVAKLLELTAERTEDVEGEFAALRSLRNEHIACLLEAYKSSDNQLAVFILEKLQGADVLTYLASRHEYTEQTVATIVSQVLDGLQYLHWRGLCHLDLQPDNVVMCGVRSVQVKLVDLGSAHRVTKLGTKVPVLGHPEYVSPEVISEEPAFPQTDIWSVGVLTYLMLSGASPFKGEDENETRQNILFVRYRFEHLYQEVSQEGTRFIMLLFKRHPNKRPTADECHENRWLLPTDYMIKKRERAVFLGHRLKEICEEYHNERSKSSQGTASRLGGKSLIKSHSIQEELLTAP